MKKSAGKGHNTWQDHYTRKAKKDKYPARSVYKLQEIQRKYAIIKPGDKVLDLGCSPGSWLLYAAEIVGKNGRVLGIDLKPVSIAVPAHVEVYTGDITDYAESDDPISPTAGAIGGDYRVILSDMAPSTTGNKRVDSARSYNLCHAALSIAESRLVTGGSFVCKIFQGEDFKGFVDSVRTLFKTQKIFKPQSSRKASKEIYIIGMERRE
jgi:23S rRNA (uridine2552-2'-O)-methyltransferase